MSSRKDMKVLILKIFLLITFLSLIYCNISIANSSKTFIWQDFEYWDSPQNHGWQTSTPFFPVFGPYPIGYGTVNTVIDFHLQSRVLKLESFATPFNGFYRFRTWNGFVTYPNGYPITDKKVMSMNIIDRFGIERFDHFEVQVHVITRNGKHLNLIYKPTGIGPSGPEIGSSNDFFGQNNSYGNPDSSQNPLNVVYYIGRQYMDGTWHMLVRDIDEDIRNIGIWNGIDFQDDGFGELIAGLDPGSSMIYSITLIGFNIMVDNIAFHQNMDCIINHPPKLQRIGPQFAQIFTQFSCLIKVNDVDDDNDYYSFIATIGGYGMQGVQTSNMIYRIEVDPNSTTLNEFDPLYFKKCDSGCIGNIILIEFTPQVFEDLIVTIKVTDPGGLSDVESFPIFVVNYPIINYPPYLEEIEDDVYILGDNDGYFVKEFVCYDQDLEDRPGYSDPSKETGNIVYNAFIDGQSSYRYGPWMEPLIPERFRPRIEFRPQFEATHTITVVAQDQMGLQAITFFNLTVVTAGTWLNHPPILCEDIDSPQIGKAGKMLFIPIEFIDPDNDEIYYSCNIGSITKMTENFGITSGSSPGKTIGSDIYGRYSNGAVYNFLTHFPGVYFVEIIAYDIRGGFCIVNFILDIQPWWTN